MRKLLAGTKYVSFLKDPFFKVFGTGRGRQMPPHCNQLRKINVVAVHIPPKGIAHSEQMCYNEKRTIPE